MGTRLRLSPQTIQTLEAFLEAPKNWKYGYDISRNTGLRSGTLYPILMRLAQNKVLETRWEIAESGRPPRHMYRLTPAGLRFTRERLPERSTMRAPRAAFGEGLS
jgi:PadR family transcriptional regulator, regulatory protein PadR